MQEENRLAMDRVVVFVDWQNTYRNARSAFHYNRGPVQLGNVHPMRLGERLAQAKPGRELTEVRVYRGQPDSTKDPKSYGANRRQQAAWERTGAKVISDPCAIRTTGRTSGPKRRVSTWPSRSTS